MRILATLLLLVFSFGCSKSAPKEKGRRPLKLCFSTDVRTLDPRFGGEVPSSYAIRMLFDGLVRRNARGEIAPSIAKSYDIFENNTVYIFHLRKTLWSDGHPVTAHDFEYAWKKSLDPKSLSHGAQNFYMIKNAKESVEGKVSPDEVGVLALDDSTLRVELIYPAPYFVDTLCTTLFWPIPKHIDTVDAKWAFRKDGSFVSNGPFCLKEWRGGESMVLEKNPRYWDKDSVSVPRVDICFIEDGTTQLYLFEKKEIDWIASNINRITLEAMKSIQKTPCYKTIESASLDWYFVNTEKFPFSNAKLRKALAYAIDRQGIVSSAIRGGAQPAHGILSPCFQLKKSPWFQSQDLPLARKLFAEALKELDLTVETFPVVTIRGSTRSKNSAVLQVTQQNWQDAFGIKVEFQFADWPSHFSSVQKGNYQIGAMGWVPYTFDPVYMLQTFQYKDDLVNMSNWENREYQELLERSNFEIDPEKRKELLIKAEGILMEEMPVIPLHFYGIQYTKVKELAGMILTPSGEFDVKYANFQ